MKSIKHFIGLSLILITSKIYSQTPAAGNTLQSTGLTSIASTTNASYKLSINGAVKQYGTGLNAVLSPTLFLQNTTASTGRTFGINASDAGALQIFDVTATNAIRFIINNSGNTGIGTGTPISLLHVNGIFTVGSSTTNGGVVGTVQITNNGLSPIANRLTFGTDGTGWKFAISKNQGGTISDYLTIQDNGLVGIGTTTPGFNLDVAGNGRFTSSVTGNSFIKSGGTSSQFLKADGSVDATSYLTANQSITASGDLTGTGTTALPLTLATVNANTGSFTNANITVDAKGRITAASNGSAGSGITGTGSINYLPKFTGTSALSNSLLYDNGTSVGIGTTSPFANLEVKSPSTSSSTPVISASGFNIGWDENRFYSNSTKAQIGLSYQGSDLGGLTYWNDGNIFGSGLTSNDKLIFNYGHSTDQLTFLRLLNPGTNLANFALEFRNTVSGPSTMWQYAWGSGILAWNQPLTIGSVSSYPVKISADPGNPNRPADIFIQNSKVGIGTETPNANVKLDVNGNIYSNGKIAVGPAMDWTKINSYALAVNGSAIFTKAVVMLYDTWPDYVFDKNYKARSIEEIETFITANKHLPDIPSAKEVEKNGIDLGDNQALLLKKIEELTLLMIGQNKKIEDLKNQIQYLKNK